MFIADTASVRDLPINDPVQVKDNLLHVWASIFWHHAAVLRKHLKLVCS